MHLLHIVCQGLSRKVFKLFCEEGFFKLASNYRQKSRHEGNHYHQHARKTAEGVISRFEKPGTTIPSQINATLNSRHDKYPQILKILSRTIHLLGKQGLALRGHRESKEDRENKENNPGNFIEFLREIANYSPELAEHMEKLAIRNATYLSPQSQNELIGVIGINSIQNDLIDEIKKSGCFSIMADEVTTSNEGIVSLCLREVFIQLYS